MKYKKAIISFFALIIWVFVIVGAIGAFINWSIEKAISCTAVAVFCGVVVFFIDKSSPRGGAGYNVFLKERRK